MSKPQEKRPPIDQITNGAELARWYWLKDELAAQARAVGVKSTGAKFDILKRLAHFLDTGEKIWPLEQTTRAQSKFDWHSEPLTLETPITDNYKNTQNVRRFFREQAGQDFKFNIAFMAWIKESVGKTLADAVAEYQRQKLETSDPNYKTDIKSHNQFNQYTRDFLADNPELGMDDVRRVWARKRAMPSDDGRHVYDRADLDL